MYVVIMKKIVPQNDNVLCTLVSQSKEKEMNANGFFYKPNMLPLYNVEAIGCNVKMNLHANDIIVANSTGTRVMLDNVE